MHRVYTVEEGLQAKMYCTFRNSAYYAKYISIYSSNNKLNYIAISLYIIIFTQIKL